MRLPIFCRHFLSRVQVNYLFGNIGNMFIDKNKTAQKVFNLIYYYYEIRRNQIK